MKAAKTQKNLKEMPYLPQKKKVLKSKGNSTTPAKTNVPISQPSPFKLIKWETELKTKLGQLQEEISKASLPVSANLGNDFKSIFWKLTKEKFTLHEVNFRGTAKISAVFYQ